MAAEHAKTMLAAARKKRQAQEAAAGEQAAKRPATKDGPREVIDILD